MTTETHYEYGYRYNGEDHWGIDHGTDGTWIPSERSRYGLPSIDLPYGKEEESIRRVLDAFGVAAAIIRRKITVTVGVTEALGAEPPLTLPIDGKVTITGDLPGWYTGARRRPKEG